LTPLGRWARKQLRDDLPLPVPVDVTPAEVIAAAARFEHWEDRDRVAGEWLAAREPVDAALELLTAAEDMSAFPRAVAAGVARSLGGAARPAWQQAAEWSRLGPQAREVLTFGTGEEVSDRDWRLLVVEDAAAALQEHGPDAALTRIWQGMPGDTLDEQLAAAGAAEHADAPGLVKTLREFIASGAPRSINEVMVLKVSLAGFRPPVWRRIEMPAIATLETLHWVIQELFAWDGDHLHVFEVGRKQYGCADMSVEDAADAAAVRLKDAFAAAENVGGKIEYTYDLGTCWRHEITLEKTVSREPGKMYPVCVAFKGDQPVEYWSEEDPQDPEPFDLAEVNRSLSHLGSA
ncbi:MAG TPA: plasmid pRiA4b ORF-3 family protein, partial [Trebonia sp.]